VSKRYQRAEKKRRRGFFATLKRELDGLDGRRSAAEVRQSVFMYIETDNQGQADASDVRSELFVAGIHRFFIWLKSKTRTPYESCCYLSRKMEGWHAVLFDFRHGNAG